MQFIAKHIFNFLVKPGTVYVKRSIRIASEITLFSLSKNQKELQSFLLFCFKNAIVASKGHSDNVSHVLIFCLLIDNVLK